MAPKKEKKKKEPPPPPSVWCPASEKNKDWVVCDMGSVTAQFDVPPQARLGDYQIRVEDVIQLTGDSSGDSKLLGETRVKIAEFEAPPMDEAIREELESFVERRKAEGGAPTDF